MPSTAAVPQESMILSVKKHPMKNMAFINFRSNEAAQAILTAPPTSICGVSVLPPRPHQSDPCAIVLKWSDLSDLSEQDLANHLEAQLQGRELGTYPPANLWNHEAMATHTHTLALPGLPPVTGPPVTGSPFAGSPLAGSPTPAASCQAQGGVVNSVKKHPSKNMAYVTFASPEYAQAILANPPGAIYGVPVLPPRAHDQDPSAIVVKWPESSSLHEQAIEAEFNTMLLGSPWSQGLPRRPQEQVVVSVKRHPTKPMAFVAFREPQHAQAVLSVPPATICGVPVLPPRQHESDPRSVVLKWNEGHILREEDIAIDFDAYVIGGTRIRPPAGASPRTTTLSLVQKVTKHNEKPIAIISFLDPRMAQLVLQDPAPTTHIGRVPVDPVVAHRSDSNSLVLFWRRGYELAPEEIAGHFENLVQSLAQLSGIRPIEDMPPQSAFGHVSPPTGGTDRGAVVPIEGQFVVSVKKHASKPIAFVQFTADEVAAIALQDPEPAAVIGHVPVDPIVAHKSDGRTVVLFWRGGYDLAPAVIAGHFEHRIGSLLQADKQAMVGWHQVQPFVLNVQRHREKRIIFVTFVSADIAQVVLQDGAAQGMIGRTRIDPITQHKTDPAGVCIFWHTGPDLTPEEVATHFEVRLSQLVGITANGAQVQGVEETKVAIGLEASANFVAYVKTARHKKTGFVTFQTAELCQVVLQDPQQPRSIMGVPIDTPVQHKTEPNTVVIFWKNAMDLPEAAISAHFEARVQEILVGIPQQTSYLAVPGVGACLGSSESVGHAALGPEAGAVAAAAQGRGWRQVACGDAFSGISPTPFESENGLVVRKHGSQPMAFIFFPHESLSQTLVEHPPEHIGGVPVLPVRPHNTNSKAIVLRWQGTTDLPEAIIAAGLQEILINLLGTWPVEGKRPLAHAMEEAETEPDAKRMRLS